MTPGRAVDARVWRILSPRWAHAPLSGEGAARNGGRWNRPGTKALYLSEQVETAFAEYQQEIGVRPGTFVVYDLKAEDLADLTDAASLNALAISERELRCPWKSIAWVDGETPPTWALADRLEPDHPGVRVPSVPYAGGTNIVLWRWNDPGAPQIKALDPLGEPISERAQSGHSPSTKKTTLRRRNAVRSKVFERPELGVDRIPRWGGADIPAYRTSPGPH